MKQTLLQIRYQTQVRDESKIESISNGFLFEFWLNLVLGGILVRKTMPKAMEKMSEKHDGIWRGLLKQNNA